MKLSDDDLHQFYDLINRGALFVVNHSGGKDSQAMTAIIHHLVPDDQIVIVHSHLPEVEWENTQEFIIKNSFGHPVYVTEANKTFFDMVNHRQMFPSPQHRQCTSDLKRGPLEKLIRHILKERDQSLIVSCMGMRAEESPNRAKKPIWKHDKRNSKAGREWYQFLPIHKMLTDEVFQTIQDAGQKPFWIYAEGMTRKSCCFCIMASEHDICTAARLRPDLAKTYIDKEQEIGQTMFMPSKNKDMSLKAIIERGKNQKKSDLNEIQLSFKF
jgi:DNA sulfur modification protein DndC